MFTKKKKHQQNQDSVLCQKKKKAEKEKTTTAKQTQNLTNTPTIAEGFCLENILGNILNLVSQRMDEKPETKSEQRIQLSWFPFLLLTHGIGLILCRHLKCRNLKLNKIYPVQYDLQKVIKIMFCFM